MAAQGSKNKANVHHTQTDGWTTREKLILSCSVLRSGDQNWVSVSRTIRPICEAVEPRSTEFFSQKNCAQKYADLLESVDTPKRKRTSNDPGGTETPQEQILRRLTFERIEELKLSVKEDHEQHRLLKQDIEAIRSGKVDSDLKKIWEDIQSGKKISIGQLLKEATPESSPSASQAAQSQTPTLHRSRHQRVTKTTPKFQTYKEQLKQQQARYHHQHPAQHHTQQHQTQQQHQPLPQATQGHQLPLTSQHHNLQQLDQKYESQPKSLPSQTTTPQRSLQNQQTEKSQQIKVEIEPESVPVDAILAVNAVLPVTATVQRQKTDSSTIVKSEKENKDVVPQGTSNRPILEKRKMSTVGASTDTSNDKIKTEDHSQYSNKIDKPNLSLKIKEEKLHETDVVLVDDQPSDLVTDNNTKSEDDVDRQPTAAETEVDASSNIDDRSGSPEEETITQSNDLNDEVPTSTKNKEKTSATISQQGIKKEETCKEDLEMVEAVEDNEDTIEQCDGDLDDGNADVSVNLNSSIDESSKTNQDESQDPIKITSDDETTNQEDSMDHSSLRLDDTRSDVDSNSVVGVTETQSIPSPTPKRKSRGRQGRHGKRKISTSRTEDMCDESIGSMDDLTSEKDDGESEQASLHDPKDYQDEDSNDSRCTETDADSKRIDKELEASRLHAIIASPASPALSTGSNCDPETAQAQKTWRKSIMLVWKAAASHRYANVFLHPVKNDEAPGYRDVIHRPMDLQTIKKNIETGGIRTTSEFQRDMMLMFQNAIMYNNSDHDVFRMAQEMRDDVMEQIQSYIGTQLMMQSSDRDSKTLRGHKSEEQNFQNEMLCRQLDQDHRKFSWKKINVNN